jgi:pyridoxamine 5'-phosphate oxidase
MNSTDNNLQIPADPLEGLSRWLKEAEAQKLSEPNAMTLATVGADGRPSARIVLFKGFSSRENGERGLRFFTNFESRKARELLLKPQVSLVFHWASMARQIRIEGSVEKVSRAESEAYFKSRARGSQIGAWASPQSQTIEKREDLERLVADIEERFKGAEIPCPENWGGFRVIPERIEFWQGSTHRLHDRLVFTKTASQTGGWKMQRLAP